MSKFEKYSLSVKYRPTTFDQIVGNETVIESLRSCLERDSGVPHTFLFQGPSGCGKTTIARIVAEKLGAVPDEIKEYNISQMRGIDTARGIIDNCRFAPMKGKVKVIICNEIHKGTNEFMNCMLEIFEEPPKHIFFILVTTEPEKLLKTIKTRCTIFQVSSLQRAKIIKLLRQICALEKVEVPQNILQKISEYCDGSPRQALVMLDQVIDIPDEETALQAILNSTVNEASVLQLCQLLLKKGTSWKTLSDTIKTIDDEPEKIRYAVLSYMTKTLLDTPSDRVPQIIDLFSSSFMYSGKAGLVMNCYLVTKID